MNACAHRYCFKVGLDFLTKPEDVTQLYKLCLFSVPSSVQERVLTDAEFHKISFR